MAVVSVEGNSLQEDSQLKLVGLVTELVATWLLGPVFPSPIKWTLIFDYVIGD